MLEARSCDPATRTPAENQALHGLGQREIDDAFAEFKKNPPPEAWQYDKSVDLEAKTANGSGTAEIAKIWESNEHSDFVTDYWEKENKREQENRKKNEKP